MTQVEVRSLSRANDASIVALSDLAAVASRIGLEHRVIGGQMVSLHVALADVSSQVPERGMRHGAARHPRSERPVAAHGNT